MIVHKPWYQHRAEETGWTEGYCLELYFWGLLAQRLRRKLFVKMPIKGIRWVYPMSWSDWRCKYGKKVI